LAMPNEPFPVRQKIRLKRRYDRRQHTADPSEPVF
jgi:hypothetical protein